MREAILAVTYRCNAKCSMCNIWKDQTLSEIEPKEYLKLPRGLRTINITGGEPFLRDDLVEVVQMLSARLPASRMIFSTNGYLTSRILDQMEEIQEFHPKVGIGVSIDGLKSMHDQIRGIPGIFDHAMTTIHELKKRGFSDLRIGMTLMLENAGEVSEVFKLSKSLGVEFTLASAHNSEIYFRKTDNAPLECYGKLGESLDEVIKSQLKSKSVKDWLRAYHTKGIYDASIRRGFGNRCRAGRDYFFMAPNGDVYPCNVLNEKLGNVTEVSNWKDLMTQPVKKRIEPIVQNCSSDCWMVCNTRSLIKAHPLRVGVWILRNKM